MLAAPQSDKRTKPRRRVAKAAKIAYGDYVFVRDCSVRDLSATGARLTTKDAHEVPDEFQLVLMTDRLLRKSRVIWRRGDDIGISFEGEARDLMHDTDPRLIQFKFL
jgi:hypothetical protein